MHEKSINLHVFKSGYFGSSDHGSATISLANLETYSVYEDKIEINYKNHKYFLEFEI